MLRTLPPLPAEKPKSQAQRDREAAAYWDSLTLAQEGWVLRKMGFHKFGSPDAERRPRRRRPR